MFDHLEYSFPGADPERIYLTTTIINNTEIDGTLGTLTGTSAGSITDEFGNVLFAGEGRGVAELLLLPGEEPVLLSASYNGTPGNPRGFGG